MITNEQKIKCPKCGESISIDDVLTHQIEEKIKKELGEENRLKDAEIVKQKKELEDQKNKLEEAQKNTQIEVNKKVVEKLASERVILWKQAQIEAEKQKTGEIKLLEEQIKDKDAKLKDVTTEALQARADKQKFENEKKSFELEKEKQIEGERKKIEEDAFARARKQNERDTFKLHEQLKDAGKEQLAEKKMLEEQLAEKDEKLRKANEKELELRKEKNKLEEDKQNFELEKQRQLDAERDKIREDAQKKAEEDMRLKILEKEKQLQDAMKVNMELQRKLQQGSQQLQGEVQELDLEIFLKKHFIYDDIQPIPKGIGGADMLQKVSTKNETFCGNILWESKRTKNWSEGWITKLKKDQREIKADVAVIVSEILPKDINNFGFRNGVWITNHSSLYGLAFVLRQTLTQVAFTKLAAEGKDEKIELLFRYLTGPEFKQKVEAIIETFVAMKQELDKEKRTTLARWGKQEKQIEGVIAITSGMHGDLRGLIGASMQSIPALESGEEREELQDEKDEREEENNEDNRDIDVKDMPF